MQRPLGRIVYGCAGTVGRPVGLEQSGLGAEDGTGKGVGRGL